MSKEERYKIAKEYVDRQMKSMQENGLKVKRISDREYENLVMRIAQSVRAAAPLKKVATGNL